MAEIRPAPAQTPARWQRRIPLGGNMSKKRPDKQLRGKGSVMRIEIRTLNTVWRRIQLASVGALLILLPACNLVGGKTTTLSLDTTPTSVAAGSQTVFSASISHNNGQFLGANWTLASTGSPCSPGCGTLSNPTNNGSPGNGDTATITYTAPNAPPNPNSVTITATSVENPSSAGSDTFTITAVVPPLVVQTPNFGADGINVPYVPVTLQATGGVAPYIWSISNGTLPDGISLSGDGVLSGTPTTAGVFNFTVAVLDNVGTTASVTGALSVIGPQANVNITGVTLHSGSTDPQFATITTNDGSQTDLWGDKDANGMVTALRNIKAQSGGTTPTSTIFALDSSANLVQFQTGDGTVFNISWQTPTTATVVAYTSDGTAIVGPVQITLPASAAAANRRLRAKGASLLTTGVANDFQVQVNHCGKPAADATVNLSVEGSLTPNTIEDILAEQTSLGTYDAQIPVLIPSSVVASTVSFCDTVANWASQFIGNWSNAKSLLAQTCMIMTATAAVSSLATGPAGLAAAAEIEAACVVGLQAWYQVDVLVGAVSPPVQSNGLKKFCDTGIPAVANLINDSIVFVQVTASIPGQPAQTTTNASYGGQGPFSPVTINFDTGGACDIQGNWAGGWSRVDRQGKVHEGGLTAAIADSIATAGAYDVVLTVTDSNGSANYTFPGEPTGENSLGTFFDFGPAVIDGVSGTAEGVLTPDGKALSGSYVGDAPGAIGGWSMIKK